MSSQPSEAPTPLAEIAQGPNAMDAFLDRNQKLLVLAAILIAAATAALIIYNGIRKSQEETAGAEFIKAEDIESLQTLISQHAGTQAANTAQLLLAERQWEKDQKTESIATLEKFLSSQPQHAAAPSARASLASKQMVQGNSDEAVKLFEEIVADPQARYLAPYALICIGDIARAAGDLTAAETSYKRVGAEFSKSSYTNAAKQRLRDLKTKAPQVVAAPPAPEPGASESVPPALLTPPTPPTPSTTPAQPTAPAPGQ